jgi:hypothetical protein
MLLGRLPILFHKCHAGKAELEERFEIVPGQIALESPALLAAAVHHHDGRRPDGCKAFEVCRIFLDVNAERNEVLFDERRQTGVVIRLVLESLTRTSRRSGAEIDQQRFLLFLCLLQRLIGVFDPGY